MSRVFARTIMVAAAIALMCAPAVMAQADFELTGIDSADPIAAGDTVTYTFTATNNGPGESANLTIIDFELPIGIPANLAAYSAGDQDAIDAADAMLASILITDEMWDDDPDTGSGLVWGVDTGLCESWTFQMQGLVLPEGASGDISFNFPAPETVTEGVVAVSSASIDSALPYGRGSCATGIEDCTGTPCMGPRVSTVDAFTAAVELVDDGSGDLGSEGCLPFVGFTPGNIAFVDRGSCAFEAKALNATLAGATAIIIGDNGGVIGPDDLITMACTDFCSASIITIPSVFVSFNNAALIHGDLASGVMATIGTRTLDPAIMTINGLFWEWDGAANADVDPNSDNNDVDVTTEIGETAVVDPPVAAFGSDATFLMVDFTDMSTGDPTSWAWDFGDDNTSADQNPSNTYAAAGTYTVSLTVMNDGGSDTATADVTVVDEDTTPVLDMMYFFAAAAKAEGAADSFFLTDATVNNAGASMATYMFKWLPRGTDNSDPMMSDMFTLDAGMSVVYSDVLGAAFGLEDGAVGSLMVASDSMDLLLMSRTYNQLPAKAGGTFGQAFAGIAMADLIPADSRMRILFFVENDDFRSNLGLMNGTGADLTVKWERFLADGTSVETGFSTLMPWGNTQINTVFADEAPVNGGYVDVWTEDADGMFAAYGSLLDNATSDPTTILPQ